jgi:predicted GIY-YIG superfamily endonuclease
MHYVYILKNERQEKYIGCTFDLKKRLQEHNNGETKTTRNNGVYKIVWYCSFTNKDRAYEFEKYLKSSSGYPFSYKHLL